MSGGFYTAENGLFRPLTPATGSWSRSHQNGVAIGGLLTHLLAGSPPPYPSRTARLTLDILRPAPFAPVSGKVRIDSDGGGRQVVTATIDADGVTVARGRALRVRVPHDAAVLAPERVRLSPPEDDVTPITRALGPGAPMETRLVQGSRHEVGPGAYWTRMNVPLIKGRPLPPLVAAAMAADLASGPSNILDFERWSYANIDSVLYLTRDPQGEWLLTEAETETAGQGAAVTTSRLSDRWGPFGFSQLTLFVAPR